MLAVAGSISETFPNSEKVTSQAVDGSIPSKPKVLLRFIQHQLLAQVLSQLRHEEVMKNLIRLMRIQNITCHYYVLVCISQTMRPCNRHSHVSMHHYSNRCKIHSRKSMSQHRSNGILMALMQYWIMERDVWWPWRRTHYNRTEP